MKREAKQLIEKSIDSLVLAVEHFNRPWDRGRHEATLILIDRAIELFMKAALLHRNLKIREAVTSNTYGFERCVSKCVSEAIPSILSDEESITVRLINGLRDGAQHYLIELSEQQLYVYLQAGVTLLSDKIKNIFNIKLSDCFPERVLPISIKPPKDLESVLTVEFDEIKKLVRPNARKQLEAISRLRSFAVLEKSLLGEGSQPTKSELDKYVRRIRNGESWQTIFPGVARLELTSEGTGLNVSIRLTKHDGSPIKFEADQENADALMAVKRVNELDFYSMGMKQLAEKLNLTMNKAVALVRHLDIQENADYFKEIIVGAQKHKRYSPKALDFLKKALPAVNMDEVWKLNKPTRAAQ